MTKPTKLSTKRQQRRQLRQRSKRRSSSSSSPSSSPLSLTLLSTTTLLTLTTIPQHHLLFTTAQSQSSLPCNPCSTISTGYIQIPKTNCAEFAQCSNGIPTQRFTCQSGLIYDSNMNQCNWEWGATCGPDVECPITMSPTGMPTESPVRRGTNVPTTTDDDGDAELPPLAAPVNTPLEPTTQTPPSTPDANNQPPPQQQQQQPLPPPPIRLPHHAAVWAHLNANKISISNQLLRVALRLHDIHHNNNDNHHYANNNKEDNNSSGGVRMYAYYDFYNGLKSMSEVGYYLVPQHVGGQGLDDTAAATGDHRATFYLGNSNLPNPAAIGLVNVAIFLSQAMADSISHGSCDEINTDWYTVPYDGTTSTSTSTTTLPQSNACGQYGRSYQDMTCNNKANGGEEYNMQCNNEVYYGEMEMVAANNNGNDNGFMRPDNVQPFFCGGRGVYPGTGSGEIIAGREQHSNVVEDDFPVPNRNGRVDVEGCCYWGRGTIQTTGICQYGKLNYYLGARAHAEGRHARYPTIDFCTNPQSICSTGKEQPSESSIEWITGLFRWIDSVQSYDYYNGNSNGQEDTSWNYIQKLQEFVEGGMVDGLFLHSVSAIVTQGCHEAPCPSVEGTVVTMDDANLRYSYFLQVLEALGLPVDALRQS